MNFKKYKNNPIFSSFGGTTAQLLQALLGFLVVPVLINSIGKEQYGYWVTLISIVTWIGMFDFGIGYGLRNRITAVISNPSLSVEKDIIITLRFYAVITIILFFTFFILINVNNFFSKNIFLSSITYLPVILFFPLRITIQILQGARKVHFVSFSNFLKAFIWFVIVFALAKAYGPNIDLEVLACSYAVLFVAHLVGLTIFSIKNTTMEFPRFKKLYGPLVFSHTIRVGLKFFVLQLSSILMFSLGNYMIYEFLSSELTAKYDTINKLYLTANTFFNVIINVYWSEIAFWINKDDHIKLRKIHKKLLLFSVAIGLCSFIILPVVPWFVSLWTQYAITVNVTDLFFFSLNFLVQAMALSGAVFLNAYEKMKPQIIISISSIILYFPLIWIGFKLENGIVVIPIVTTILLIPSLIVCNYYAYRLTRKRL